MKSSTCSALSLGLLGASLVFAGCAEPAVVSPRLVILYATCSVNADYLSPYNDHVTYTPNLASFADQSVVFRRHVTEAGQSGIAYASIFSGSQAPRHGAFRHPVVLGDEQYLIAEAYADAGYDTFFWGAHPMANGPLRYGQGVAPENTFDRRLAASEPPFLEILEKLRAEPDAKAFLLTTFTITHFPYKNHLQSFCARHPCDWQGLAKQDVARYVKLYRRHFKALSYNFDATVERLGLREEEVEDLIRVVEMLYRSNVSDLDRELGELLAEVDWYGLLDDSLIVFTADHGEALYRPNADFQWSHSMQLSRAVLRVPLIIRLPDPGRRQLPVYDGVTRSVDVLPTMLGLSGIPMPAEQTVEGVDLSSAVLDGKRLRELPALSHTTVLPRGVFNKLRRPGNGAVWGRVKQLFPTEDADLLWVSAIDRRFLYKWRRFAGGEWRFQVFDFENDPDERQNLYDPELVLHQKMAEQLRAYKATLVEGYQNFADDAGRSVPAGDEAEALKSLGYI